MKDNLSRLTPAIERELQEAVRRREHRQADEALRNSRQQLRDLAARLDSIREKERAWIAREIHDELGQLFTSIKYELSLLRKRISKQEEPLGGKNGCRGKAQINFGLGRRLQLRPSKRSPPN
ncbi:MAG: histidine kinase [Candidatus Manganitrophus sp.]|nr:histidine kinase [Candidatus Manganitrophus sp.]